ncbi:SGNH/GDSL hydrolase family protein [Hoyosella rhizosphaerae]|uniref:Hydrolase n=1 Tax=Hoyosella rhizosphaerae TaxID=1755582 RepID=A0A916UHK4_9ACTN|nr:SGNH/GDSL hydrolase family protein [Hoyosella rhizosphaerae]MBN4928111.1 SGNH/GDSL hydrolase family protein [Hoyosella rhizosphaerae]GGC72470.1 hydrolase [Hoyosella rhizosphaerae]
MRGERELNRASWRRVVRLIGLVIIVVIAAMLIPAASAPRTSEHYVALGDSRAAGPSTLRFLNDSCGRTAASYPRLISEWLQPEFFLFAACSGAKVENIIDTPQETRSGGGRPLQIDSVTSETTLITISIGGNDVRWYDIARRCFTREEGDDRECRNDPETRLAAMESLRPLRPRLDRLLGELRARAPQALIFLASHGGTVGDGGCWPEVPASDEDAAFIAQYQDDMNDIIRAAARYAGVNYVDLAAHSVGHDACQPRHRKWYEGNVTTSTSLSMHPNNNGNAAFAEIFKEEIKKEFRRRVR